MFIILTPELESITFPGLDLPTINSSSTRQSPKTASEERFTVRFVLISSSPGPITFSLAGFSGSRAALPKIHRLGPDPRVFQPARSFPFKREIIPGPSAPLAVAPAVRKASQAQKIARKAH